MYHIGEATRRFKRHKNVVIAKFYHFNYFRGQLAHQYSIDDSSFSRNFLYILFHCSCSNLTCYFRCAHEEQSSSWMHSYMCKSFLSHCSLKCFLPTLRSINFPYIIQDTDTVSGLVTRTRQIPQPHELLILTVIAELNVVLVIVWRDRLGLPCAYFRYYRELAATN